MDQRGPELLRQEEGAARSEAPECQGAQEEGAARREAQKYCAGKNAPSEGDRSPGMSPAGIHVRTHMYKS